MDKFKHLKIPKNAENLRDFIQFAKDLKFNEIVLEKHKKEISDYQENAKEYARQILKDKFIKSDLEWFKILSKKDYEKIVEIVARRNFDNHFIIRCGLTNNFYQLNTFSHTNKNYQTYSKFDDIKFKIEESKIIIHLYVYESSRQPKVYASGHMIYHDITTTIDLLDLSVTQVIKIDKSILTV